MKKLRLLTLLALPVVAVPFLATMSSCNSLADTKLKEINIGNYVGQTTYGNLPTSSQDLRSLVYGSSSFHGGNYCIFIANSQAQSFLTWLFDGSSISNYGGNTEVNGINDLALRPISLTDSWSQIKTYCEQLEIDFGCTFVLEHDFETHAPTDESYNHKTYKITTPFTTWSTTDKNEDDSLTVGDYRRNDADAVNYRYIVNTLISLFPGNTKVSSLTADGAAMAGLIYKDGKPKPGSFLDTASGWNTPRSLFSEWQKIYGDN